MSLDWDYSEAIKREGRDQIMNDPHWDISHTMIWTAMIVGIGTITKANAQKFFTRVHQWERTHGPINTNGEHITAADVRKRIGLRTNASHLTDAEWRKKLERIAQEEARREWEKDQ